MDRKGKWSLAPAYDITFAYKADNIWISNISEEVAAHTSQTLTLEDENINTLSDIEARINSLIELIRA